MSKRNSRRPDSGDEVSRTRSHQKYSDAIYEIYDKKCWLCGKKGADTIDHIVPVLWGGSDHPSNLKPAHRSCNSSKGASRPSKKCWTHPPMWIDGYGPRSADENKIYPKPNYPHPLAFALYIAIAGVLIWAGIAYDARFLSFVGSGIITLLIVVSYARWWWWKYTKHRIIVAAANDTTPDDPQDWLDAARVRRPGLRQIGGVATMPFGRASGD